MISPQRSRILAPPRQSDNNLPADRRSLLIRARLFGVFILLLFTGLISRLYWLQILHGPDFLQAAQANEAREIRTHAPRGTIEDINGAVLAANRSRYAGYATPDVLKNPTVLNRVAALLNESPADIVDSIHKYQQNPYDPHRIALDVPMSTVTQIEENKPFLPGVTTEPEPVRYYPHGELAAHLLGTMGRINDEEFKKLKDQKYFNDDFLGKTGIENEYEQYLHGKSGGQKVQIDARGRLVKLLDKEEPTPGDTVVLALDQRLQSAAEKVFADLKLTGAAVAINPQTGAILSMVSEPAFDPNAFASGIKPKDWKPRNSNPKHPLIDRSLDAMYPPGSTFKPIVAAAGLQTKAISTHTTAYCSGAYYLGKARFGCWQVHGDVGFYEAMAKSCDVFFYQAGQKINPDRMSYYAKQFGLAQHTGIDLPSEDIGSIPSPEWKEKRYQKLGSDYSQWFGGDTLHMSIGQGYVLTTPLQMARACAAVANGGDVLQPYVVQRVVDQNGSVVIENGRVVKKHKPNKPKNKEEVRKAMRETVTSGTGAAVIFPTVAVAAKTVSAQMHGSDTTHGWFICFAPYDHPTIAIASVVEFGGH